MGEDQREKGLDQKKLKKVSFFKLFSFADRFDVFLMLFGSLGAIANGMTRPIMTVVFGEVVSSFATAPPSQINHLVSQVCVKYVILAVGAGIASFLEMCCWMISGERQATRIRELYLQTILRQDIAFFDTQTTTGEVIGRMSGDTVTIQDAMGEKVGKFIQLVSTFFGGMIIAFLKGWRLAIVVSSCVPALLVVGGITSRGIAKMMSQGQAAYAEAGSIVEQVVGAIRTVASFSGEKEARRKYDEKLQTAYRATYQQGLVSGLGLGSLLFVTFGSYALATWYGSKMILDMGYDGGKVINIIMAMVTSGVCIGQISPCLSAFGAGQAAAYKMIKTIQRKPKIDSYDKRGLVLTDMKGEIELRNVHFRYPARPDVQIFAGFSLHIPSGKIAALVGQSGSGKSTVISLLERFYDPDVGEVLIDGIDLKKFRIRWIREKIGLVSQEPILFTTTIRENIAFGKEKASDEEIRMAIELANASNFTKKLPQGLDTMVGEHGTQLSGGQKQRIAIARAILKNPRILLLDEATSALDAESERVVQNALDQVMSDRTTIVIAHRLTTIRNADIIAVVHHGELLEQGKHDDLVKDPEGAYSKLVQMQSGPNRDEHTRSVETHDEDDTIPSDIFRSISPRTSGRRSTSSRRSFSTTQENDEEDSSIKNNKKTKKNVSLTRLAYLNKPELLVLFLGAIAASVQGLMFPMFGLAMSSAIRIFYEPPHELRRDGRFWSLIFLSIGIGTLVIMLVQNFFFGVAGGKLIRRIRSLTFEKIVHHEISWFDKPENSSGAIGARLAMDASMVRNLVGDSLALVVQNISTIACGVVIAFTANLRLALIVLVALPFVGMEAFMHMKFLKGFSANANAMYEEASQVASDAVGNIRTVASFCAEEKVMERYQRKCDGPMKQGIKTGIISGIGFGISSFALYCASSFCFYMGSVFQQHGKATFSDVFKVFFALTMTTNGVSRTFASCPDMAKARDSTASIFDILDTKSEIDSSSDTGTILDDVKGDIELRHVSFKYPTRPNIQIFRDLCLTIPSGKMVALVGESGSGKSSVISLIERFYDPGSGHVYLDGVEIHKLKLSWLRQQLGLVSQEPILFNDTIRANIGYGKQGGTSEEEVIRAAKVSNAHGFISALPQGYDTSVGERGTQLSGGQKQRIAIARAILRDPRVLLLDEATSALDAESERVVQDALDQVMVGRTSVVVAHRLSTIKGADVIAVLKNGMIVEEGTHCELLNVRDGVYASLVAPDTSSG